MVLAAAKARLEIAMALSIYRAERSRSRNRAGLQMRCLHLLERTRRTLRERRVWYPDLMREIDAAISEIAGDHVAAQRKAG